MDVIFENLSTTYIFCLATTFLCVAVAIYSSVYGNSDPWKDQVTKDRSHAHQFEEQQEEEQDVTKEDEVEMDPVLLNDFMATYKTSAFTKVKANLTAEQMQEEKEAEAQQLAAIFDLLKKQEAELNTEEIDKVDLEEQLSLYR